MKLRHLFLVLMALMCLPVVSFSQDKMAPKSGDKKTAKKMPPRDPKTGRFMKSNAVVVKKGPARDPKTGRFIKKDAGAMGGAMSGSKKGAIMGASMAPKGKMMAGAKKMPPRDPKTGRFIKKDKKP